MARRPIISPRDPSGRPRAGTLGGWLGWAEREYARRGVALGQVAPSANDEALYLLLHTLGLPLDAGPGVLARTRPPRKPPPSPRCCAGGSWTACPPPTSPTRRSSGATASTSTRGRSFPGAISSKFSRDSAACGAAAARSGAPPTSARAPAVWQSCWRTSSRRPGSTRSTFPPPRSPSPAATWPNMTSAIASPCTAATSSLRSRRPGTTSSSAIRRMSRRP